MGIKDLLPELPGGHSSESKTSFNLLEMFKDRGRPADIDVGTLIYICAIRHKPAFLQRDHTPSLREFQRQLIILNSIYRWDFTCIFDGFPPPQKKHEHARRQMKEDSIAITSDFIILCTKVCSRMFIPFVVARSEADMQAGRNHYRSVPVCRDSDLLAYNNHLVVIVDSYSKETYRVIDLCRELTEEVKGKYPLYAHYVRHGRKVIHWWAAVRGCDLSASVSGIKGAGREAFLSAMNHFSDIPLEECTVENFVSELLKNSFRSAREHYSEEDVCAEIHRVSKFFTQEACYYKQNGAVHAVSCCVVRDGKVTSLMEEGQHCRDHMKGKLDPKTGNQFTDQQKALFDSLDVHNLCHNSAINRDRVNGLSFPEGKNSVYTCTVDELRAMVIARGGNLTGRDGKGLRKAELQQLMAAYLQLEKMNPAHTVYFDRSKNRNGIFANIDTSEKRTVPDILRDLINCSEFETSIHNFFIDIDSHLSAEKFTEDYATIALEAPEMSEDFIRQSFIHVGESVTQKNIHSGLTRVLEMEKVIYHAMAWSDDGNSIYIISKQRASMKHDEATRNKTDPGERPNFAEYLVMVQISVKTTTDSTHGHTLGICTHLMRSYCAACKAGCGMCYHRGGVMWMQHLHWGEGRPTPKPATSSFCTWIPGSKGARSCSTIEPATKLHRLKMPRSNKEAEEKLKRGVKKNMHQGISAKYDIYGGDGSKYKKLEDPEYTSKLRLQKLFKCLRDAQVSSPQTDDNE